MTRTKSMYLALLTVLLSPIAANADLIGDTVDASFDVIFGDWSLDVTSNIVGLGGPEFTISIGGGRGIFIDIQATFIDFTYNGVSNISIGGCDNDCSITISNIDNLITGLSLTEFNSGDSIGFFGGNIASFTDSSFSLFVDGIWDMSDRVRVDLSFTSIPEPGTLALFGIGLFGMGLARRRKA